MSMSSRNTHKQVVANNDKRTSTSLTLAGLQQAPARRANNNAEYGFSFATLLTLLTQLPTAAAQRQWVTAYFESTNAVTSTIYKLTRLTPGYYFDKAVAMINAQCAVTSQVPYIPSEWQFLSFDPQTYIHFLQGAQEPDNHFVRECIQGVIDHVSNSLSKKDKKSIILVAIILGSLLAGALLLCAVLAVAHHRPQNNHPAAGENTALLSSAQQATTAQPKAEEEGILLPTETPSGSAPSARK